MEPLRDSRKYKIKTLDIKRKMSKTAINALWQTLLVQLIVLALTGLTKLPKGTAVKFNY